MMMRVYLIMMTVKASQEDLTLFPLKDSKKLNQNKQFNAYASSSVNLACTLLLNPKSSQLLFVNQGPYCLPISRLTVEPKTKINFQICQKLYTLSLVMGNVATSCILLSHKGFFRHT